jgi:PhzF family phenazine biosynthesis protein
LPFRQVDVFTDSPLLGNPVAVVHDADGLTDKQMRDFARWTNLSETTFLLPPRDSEADYRVRIFTTSQELPFAGHPTLGTCHAWLEAGGIPASPVTIVQECGAGLVPVRRERDGRLAFGAPPLIRSGPVEQALVDQIASVLRIPREEIVDTQWVDNGPGWVAALLASADEVLKLSPAGDLSSGPSGSFGLGVAGPYPPGSPEAFEVRAFFPMGGITVEDPVTGSLNASLAQWLLGTGRATAPYVVSQGTAIGRQGRVHVSGAVPESGSAASGIWVGGGTVTLITGTVSW